ncbi:MAG TPA: hypothetical protein VM915_09735 [Verrucomicrobiae bacterium]|jgi:hypothetical protein|nr:hypothetical protein [Verrucomicrobiae bacterium]
MIYDQLCSRFAVPREYDRTQLYFAEGEGRVYLRTGSRMLLNRMRTTLEIADVNVPEALRGQGMFRAILDDCERYCAGRGIDAMFVENVISEIVAGALTRRDYGRRTGAYPGAPCDWWKRIEGAQHG